MLSTFLIGVLILVMIGALPGRRSKGRGYARGSVFLGLIFLVVFALAFLRQA